MIDMQFAAASRGIAETARKVDRMPGPASADEIDAHVGRRLRARRIKVGLSQGALGRHLSVTFSQVQKYEKGANRIGAGRLYQLAALLEVPVHYFFDGLENHRLAAANGSRAVKATDAVRIQDAFERISDPLARQALLSLAASMVSRG